MKAKLLVDGKEFPIEILDPELQKLIAPSEQTGYERAKNYTTYFYEGAPDCLSHAIDNGAHIDNSYYDNANYYTSCEVAKNNMRADKLMRQLRRFAVERREFVDGSRRELKNEHWTICYNYGNDKLVPMRYENVGFFATPWFNSERAANAAISRFKKELIWYFTEYKDSAWGDNNG